MGELICHDNYMPLVRYSLYGRGIEIYFAPTYDEGEAWHATTLRHIGREGRVFIVGCSMTLRKEDILSHSPQLEPYYAAVGEWVNAGNSMIADPNGDILAGPLALQRQRWEQGLWDIGLPESMGMIFHTFGRNLVEYKNRFRAGNSRFPGQDRLF